MTDATAFQATYSDWRLIKSRKVVQIVFELPIEQANLAYQVLGGMPNPAAECWCAIARLDVEKLHEGDAPVPPPLTADSSTSASASRRGEPSPDKRLAQRAGILSNDPMFHRYLGEKHHIQQSSDRHANGIVAAVFVRQYCHVQSRAEIKPGTDAATRLDLLQSAFVCWRDTPEYADAR